MDLLRYLFRSSKRDQFADRLVCRVKQAGETREIRYERDPYRLSFFDQGELTGAANLANLFHEYDRLPAAEREAYLVQVARAILSHHKAIPEAFEDAQPDILPLVRSRTFLEISRLQQRLQGGTAAESPYVEIGSHLLAVPVYDLPEAMRTIDPPRMHEWNRTLYELMETALENLDQLPATVTTIDERVFLFRNQDHYDASRMLLLDRVRSLVQGQPVAMVPTRDCLVVTGDADERGLKRMLDLVKQQRNELRPVSLTPCRLSDGGWETWLPPPEHSLHEPFRELHLNSLSAEYHQQRTAIEAAFTEIGCEGFVANHYLFRDAKNRQLRSYCVWPECDYALLPETDYVVFMDRHHMQPKASGTWQQVVEAVGGQMENLECYPPRYRVLGFPAADTLRQIGIIPSFRM